MTAEQVVELLDLLEASGVDAWVDGGWGVDALLGYQSRRHDDLDLVVALGDVEQIRELLGSRGFRCSEDALPVRFVMLHAIVGQVDFHTVTFDADGGGVQPQPSGGKFRYPPEGFTFGTVLGRRVPCISAAVQVLCHTGYDPTEKDAGDMLLLHRKLGVSLPPVYERFAKRGTG